MTLLRSILTRALALAFTSCPAWAGQDFYVDSLSGNDLGPGSASQPWATISHAAANATPGSTVHIAAGVYAERVVISVSGDEASGPIVFSGDPAGGTVLDGSGFGNADFATWNGEFGQGLVDITDQSWLRLEHLELRGPRTSSTQHFLHGITVAKSSHVQAGMSHIELVDLDVHDVRYTGSSPDGGAQGVSFYGGNTQFALSDVAVIDCRIHDLRLGQSETITFNGNVERFLIEGCEIHDNDNIGISIIGWEGTAGGSQSDDDSDANAHIYGGHYPADRARSGVVRGNTVYRCSTDMPVNNPTYPANDFSAGGVYVDGGLDILIERNAVYQCDLGVEIASEHGGVDTAGQPRDARGVLCRNNVIAYCGYAGISIGGYNEFRGLARECVLLGNTIYKCGSLGYGTGQIHVVKAQGNRFVNNVLVARSSADTGDYDGLNNSGLDWMYDHGVVLGSSLGAPHNASNTLESNLVFCADGLASIHWKWEMTDSVDPVQGFAGLAAIDTAALFGDPQFVQGGAGTWSGAEDLRPSGPGSPVVDVAQAEAALAGAFDAAGTLRQFGTSLDRGAHEYGSAPPLGEVLCLAGANSAASFGAELWMTGSASVAANDLVLHAGPIAAGQPGLFFYSDALTPSGLGRPFGEGHLCLGAPLTRVRPPVSADAGGFVSRAIDGQSPAHATHWTAGSSLYFQLWYRDPAAGDIDGDDAAEAFSVSAAYGVVLGP